MMTGFLKLKTAENIALAGADPDIFLKGWWFCHCFSGGGVQHFFPGGGGKPNKLRKNDYKMDKTFYLQTSTNYRGGPDHSSGSVHA